LDREFGVSVPKGSASMAADMVSEMTRREDAARVVFADFAHDWAEPRAPPRLWRITVVGGAVLLLAVCWLALA
jgi:hypothetical protein